MNATIEIYNIKIIYLTKFAMEEPMIFLLLLIGNLYSNYKVLPTYNSLYILHCMIIKYRHNVLKNVFFCMCGKEFIYIYEYSPDYW